MKVVKQSVTLAPGQKDGKAIILNLERCGRISHRSEPIGTLQDAEAFIRKLIGWGHESVLEHESVTLRIVTDRGVSHELVRHRIGTAFTQESSRYNDYKEGLEVIVPPGLGELDTPQTWIHAIDAAEDAYRAMRLHGIKPEVARSVLPTCMKTELYMTANIREWRHIIRLRSTKAAHPQMRELMGLALDVLGGLVPVCFEDLAQLAGAEA